MEAERVVGISFGKLSAGSGYLLSDKLAVTAAHVVKPRRIGEICSLKPLLSSALQGKAVWLSEDEDLALIESDPPGWPQLPPAPAGFSKLGWSGALSGCEARGFPIAAGESDLPITATLSRIANPSKLKVDVNGAHPNKPEWWAGFSGTVLFYRDLPIGVVDESALNFTNLLTATPIENLFGDESFKQFWRSRGLPPLPEQPLPERELSGDAASVHDKIASCIFWLDREEQAKDVTDYLRQLPKSDQVLPQVIGVPGLDEDEHTYFMLRLARHREVQDFLRNRGRPEDVITLLSWPEVCGRIDPSQEFVRIVSELYRDLGLPEHEVDGPFEADPAKLRMALDRPRAFSVYVRQANALGGYSDLLQRLVEFWGKLGRGAPALLFVCLANNKPKLLKRKLSFFSASPTPEKLLTAVLNVHPTLNGSSPTAGWKPLADLAEIEVNHLRPWMEVLHRECRSVSSTRLDGLYAELGARLSQKKRLRQVRDEISDVLLRSTPARS